MSEELLTELRAAKAGMQAERYDRVIPRLLAAWRICRASELSLLLERMSEEPGIHGLAPEFVFDAHEPGLERLVQATEAEPRVAVSIARFLTMEDGRESGTRRMMLAGQMYLRRHPDARALAIAEAGVRSGISPRVEQGHAHMLEVMRADLATRPELPPEALELIAWIRAAIERLPFRRGSELLAAIYANPSDLALRRVFADLLLDRGDPRGEFINLQLTPERERDRARERELVYEYGRAWAGALGRAFVLNLAGAFERGFFVGGRVLATQAFELRDDPAWALIERADELPGVLLRELELPSLRTLACTHLNSRALSEREQPLANVETLWIRDGAFGGALDLLARGWLPALRELTLSSPDGWLDDVIPLFEQLARTRLQRFGVSFEHYGAAQLRAFVLAHDVRPSVLEIDKFGLALELRDIDDERFVDLRVDAALLELGLPRAGERDERITWVCEQLSLQLVELAEQGVRTLELPALLIEHPALREARAKFVQPR